MTEPTELLPCPFCGSAAHFEMDEGRWEWVECESCGMQGNRSASLMEDCKPKLAEEWNRRTPKPAPQQEAVALLPEHLTLAVDQWFAQNTGLGGCSDKDVAQLAAIFYGVTYDGGRESVDDALAVVESFGPGIEGLNDTYARQVILAQEVLRLHGECMRSMESHQTARNALRAALDHIDMNALRISHCKDAAAIDAAQAYRQVAPAMPPGWVPCTIEFDGSGPEEVAYGPKIMMDRLAKWLGKHFERTIGEKAAPQQEVQEPAFWTRQRLGEDREFCEKPFTTDWTPLYTEQPAPSGDAARLEALHAAVTAIYLDDSSDFKSALGAVVRHLDPSLAGDMLAWPKRAYDISQARLDAARKEGNKP